MGGRRGFGRGLAIVGGLLGVYLLATGGPSSFVMMAIAAAGIGLVPAVDYEARDREPAPAPPARAVAEAPKARLRDTIPARLRFEVLHRDGFRCTYCGRSQRDVAVLHVDHVEPVARGGATDEGNLVTACQDCNLGKGTTRSSRSRSASPPPQPTTIPSSLTRTR